MRKKKTKVVVAGIPYPFHRQSSGVNCNYRPFFMAHKQSVSFGLDVLRAYLQTICGIFFTENFKAESAKVRALAAKQLALLTGHFIALETLERKEIAFGGMEPKQAAMFHANKFSGADFTTAVFNKNVVVADPKSLPTDRDITNSPSVRVTFEPIRKRETAVFQEELESISAFQLGQRIVSKRYQFNGVHGNYLHSRMIVTETPEEIREIPDIDLPEYVEVLEDPSTWLVKPAKFVPRMDLGKFAEKFNQRRHK